MLSEENFPRGRDKVKKELSRGKDVQETFKKAQKRKKIDDSLTKDLKRVKLDVPERVFQATLKNDLCTGLSVLGCVRQVFEHTISISLPGNAVGTLPITELSTVYTQQLKKFVHDKGISTDCEVMKPLNVLYRPGMLLPVHIEKIDLIKDKKKIVVSNKSSKINCNVPIKGLFNGMLLFGHVSSVEDHGYGLDLGISGLQAFLPQNSAEAYIKTINGGSTLCIGQPLWCVVNLLDKEKFLKDNTRVLIVSIDPVMVKSSQLTETTKLNCILPGTNVKGVVNNIFKTGLGVSVNGFHGNVNASQLPLPVKRYSVGQQMNLKVLYVDNSTKQLQLTAHLKIVTYDGHPIEFCTDLKIGNVCEAKVVWIQKKGVFFNLPGNTMGFAAMNQLSDNEMSVKEHFHVNSSHQCRILGFNYMESLALITLKRSIIQMKFVRLEEIHVGDVFQVTVKKILATGVLVKVAKCLFSFIPCLHLADVPIKHPEKKFAVGMKLKCRVLRINQEKNKIYLTHKRSLVKTKFPVISDYNQLKPQMQLEGFISAVNDTFAVVTFFNNVKGFVNLKYMRDEKEDLTNLYYEGQVIRCRVIYFSVPEHKLQLSFHLEKQQNSTETFSVSDRKKSEADILSVGTGGYTLIMPDKRKAFLPFHHLSDFHEIQELRKLALKSGQQLSGLTFFKQKDKITMTMKESFLSASEECNKIEKFEDLKVGMLLPAVIKNHQDYGIFLEIVCGFTGLCPSKTLGYLQPTMLQDLFKPGQSVMTRLIKIDTEKQRFLGSLHINECSDAGLSNSLTLLKSYLHSKAGVHKQLLAENDLSSYKDLKVGSVVQVIVNAVLKKGILCETESGAKGLVTKDHLGNFQPEVGKHYRAVILFIDLLTPCVELTLETKVVQSVLSCKENLKSQLKKNQILKAELVLLKPEFILMKLKGHGNGKFAYVPVRQHLNDVETNRPYKLRSYTEIVLKDCIDDFQLAVLKVHDLELKKCSEEIKPVNVDGRKVELGLVVEAKIRAIHRLQMNVMINQFHGRIHITEVTDNLPDGDNPFRSFHPEQYVKVRIIGYRDLLTHSHLPITQPDKKTILLEVSMKESKMLLTTDDFKSNPKTGVAIGDQMLVYVSKVAQNKVWVQVSTTQQGYIDFFYLSNDVAVLNNPNEYFKPGQGYHATVRLIESDNRIVFTLIDSEIKIAENQEVTAVITAIKNGKTMQAKLPGGVNGIISQEPSVLNYIGQYVKCTIDQLNAEKKTCLLSLVNESNHPSRKIRKRKNATPITCPEKKTTESGSKANKKVQHDLSCVQSQTPQARLAIDGFSWKGDILCSDIGSHNSDSDDEEMKSCPNLVKKKKQAEEMIIQEHELDLIKNVPTVQSPEDFEKLVLQSPNSSVIWVSFMSYHVELGEVEKARTVAERALAIISFREEKEKLNVWMAYLNMESMFGDPADVKKLLERAVASNDPLDIYLKMCDIYAAQDKNSEAEALFKIMTQKFKHEKLFWKNYGQFMFKIGQVDNARRLLQRAIVVLDKKDHVEVIVKYATLEFSFGDIERGRTIFENLIASYPGRTDLWSVYVDMVTKAGDITGARQILERAVKQKLNPKKLSFLIQKFKKFEETHGDEKDVEKFQQLATTLLN